MAGDQKVFVPAEGEFVSSSVTGDISPLTPTTLTAATNDGITCAWIGSDQPEALDSSAEDDPSTYHPPLGIPNPYLDPDDPELILPPSQNPACNDESYKSAGYYQPHTYVWLMRRASIPNYLDASAVIARTHVGGQNIDTGNNDCGFTSDQEIGADVRYDGVTDKTPDFGPDGGCMNQTNTDGTNVVGFGFLTSGSAKTCVWGDVVENGLHIARQADIRFDQFRDLFYTKRPANCYLQYGVNPVATHEFGHVFGLDHVDPDYMTMAYNVTPCSARQSTLGRGEWERLYHVYNEVH